MSQYLCDTPFRLLILISIIRNLYDHFMSSDRTFGQCLRYKNILIKLLVVRNHESISFARIKGSNQFFDAM